MESNILLWNKEEGFIRISEGDGSNLLSEDEAEGYVDYIMVDFLEFDGYDELVDAGEDNPQVMLTELYQEQFKTVDDVINHLIKSGWIPDVSYTVLYAE